MRVMLANDTGIVAHVGCLGVSDAHARMLGRAGHHVGVRYFIGELSRFRDSDPERGLRRVLDDEAFMTALGAVDALIVNGEGTIHHGAGTEYLHVLAAAAHLGKGTLLVNCVLEAIEGFDRLFATIDDIVVRDARSARWLAGRGRAPRCVPDSFIEAAFDRDPILDLSGHVAVTDWHHQRDADSGRAALGFMRDRPQSKPFFFPLMSGDLAPFWRKAPATLRTARAIVTGRHHGAYCALLADRPFVALSGNTHKLAGLLDAVPELGRILDPPDVGEALEWATAQTDAFARLREIVLAARPLSTFARLGGRNDGVGEAREVDRLRGDIDRLANSEPADLGYRMKRRSVETCSSGA